MLKHGQPQHAITPLREVLKLVDLAGGQESLLLVDELQTLAKMFRDLSGYPRYAAGDKPDPVRGDLVRHANQLLPLNGL